MRLRIYPREYGFHKTIDLNFIASVLLWLVALSVPAYAAGNPSISSISPSSGAVGASINISGSGFGTTQGTSSVTFNGKSATTITSWSSSSITAIVPSGATSGNVIVTVSGKTSNAVSFTILPTPALSSLSPSSGPTGSTVTLTGSNFGATQGSGYVLFYGTGQTSTINSWSNTSISTVVPSNAKTGNVVVNTNGVSSNGILFTVWPYITGVSPSAATAGGSVTISGANFGSTQGNGSVSFGGINASIVSWSDTSVTATVPNGATSGNIVVTANGESSNGFNFVVGAVSSSPYHLHQEAGGVSGTDLLSTASPDTASTVVQSADLKGNTNTYPEVKTFTTVLGVPGYIPAGSTITFTLWMQETASISGLRPNVILDYIDQNGYVSSICWQWSSSSLTTTLTKFQFTCPIANGLTLNQNDKLYADVGVYNTGGSITKSDIVQLYIEGALNGNYDSQITVPEILYPYITNVSRSTGTPGVLVTITGGQFGATQGSSTVTFNGAAGTPSSWSDTSVTVPVPADASTGPLVITVSGQSATWGTFTVPPVVTGYSPASGPVGTLVTVSGSGFGSSQGTSSISFGGVPAVVISWTANSIVARVPIGAPTDAAVSVTVNGVAGVGPYFYVSPWITGISPANGPIGTSVRISGYNLAEGLNGNALAFNGAYATQATWLDRSIVTTVPLGASSGPVVVTANNVASNQVTFTVVPGITSMSPVSGSAGTVVTISGTSFGSVQGSSRVLFNGIVASPTSWSDTSIVVPVPLNASTGPVTIVGQTTSSNGVVFSILPSISSLSPNSGLAGTVVTISGSNFGPSQGTGYVTFGGVTATPTSWSGSKITVPVPGGAATGQVIVAAGGQLSNGVAFTVGGGTLTGTVVKTSDGTPIAGAAIQVVQSGHNMSTSSTAADGTYSIGNLPGATYDVIASATGFGTSLNSGIAVSANANATANFSLAPPGTISGTVTKTDGTTGINGATVSVSQSGDVIGTAATDSSGNYSIATLSAGTYTAKASTPGYTGMTQSGLVVTSNTVTSVNFSLSAQSVISYSYDASGRLIAVSDSQSDTAVYQYDAVGNILGISRHPSSQTSIIAMTPGSGPIGTTVTITGTGFSSTSNQNAVSFNGTAASVNSSSATQLSVVVPNGATTGTVSVTAPSGAATSPGAFTVTSSAGVPTITSFSPASGAPGTSVTITGTGFDPTSIDDVVKANLSPASVTSATATSLVFTVPNSASSGHISVATKAGTATSSQDLYIPFGTHPATDIGFTGRMTANTTQSVSINTAGQIGLLLFDGTAGQSVSITVGSSTFASCNLLLIDPLGHQLGATGCGSGGYLSTQTLAYSGTYTIGVEPSGTTGSVAVTLNAFNTVTGILRFGVATLINTSYSGQKAKYIFSGTAGQVIDLSMTGGTYNSCPNTAILNPDGSTLFNRTACGYGNQDTGNLTLPSTGTYSVLIDPANAAGGITATLTQRITETLQFNTPLSVSSTLAGQMFNLTFSGTAGQVIDLSMTGGTYNSCPNTAILNPDGSTLFNRTACGYGNQDTGNLTLPSTGTYSVLIDPANAAGGITATLTPVQ